MTYPAREVPGIMVTGMLTPGFESPFTWPSALAGEPFWRTEAYQFDAEPPAGQDGGTGYIQRLCHMVRVRTSVALSLLRKVPQWRLCCIVFVATDRVQHYFWSAVDETHPQYDGTLSRNVRELWRTVDQCVAELFDEAGDDTPKMVLSDHGFGPLWKVVDLNALLAREGLLTYRGRTLLRRLHLGLGIRARLGIGDADDGRTSAIDWARTVAYAGSETEEAVYVNLGGREPWGAVASPSEYEDVRRKLRAVLDKLIDPETGDQVVVRCLPREELYHGPWVDRAPDLLLELRPGYKVMNDLHRGSVVLPVGRGTYAGTGRHQRDGVLLMQGWGPVKQGPHHLRDVLPTILAALDCPAPQGLEGSSVLDT
jgi:predicted AlkP superfamily phosphohydrolase/phosphomutase